MGKKEIDLEKSYLFLKSIQDNAAHAIIATTTDGVITSFNKMAENILGYKAEELIGKETPAIFHDLDEVVERAQLFSQKLDKEIQPGFDTFVCHTDLDLKNEFEWVYIHKDGTKFSVLLSITAIRDDKNETVGYLGIAQDLTEQKLLEKELKHKNTELEAAQSIAKIGSWSFDIKSQTIKWSKEMFNIFPEKIEHGEPGFEKHRSTIHSEDIAHWEATVNRCITDGQSYTMLFRTHKIDNKDETVWVEAKGRGKVVDGEVISLSGTCQDVSERVLKEQELKEYVRALEEAQKAKSEFLANMSHEIRTPMNGIMGMLDLLKDTELSEQQQELLKTVSSSSNILLTILSDILDLSKIEAGKLEIEKTSFDLDRCMNEIYELMQAIACDSGAAIEMDIPVLENPWVLGDETRIRQILMNFISNAVKFSEKGKVKIGLDISSDENKKYTFYVEDDGIGISAKDQKRLFEAFEQADKSTTRKYGGTGLGLTIAASLAQLMGGKVYCKSRKGKGSTFFLELILEAGKKHVDKKIESKVEVVSDSKKLADQYPHSILLVEDNIVNQKVIVMTLAQLGYQCDIAGNGLEALDILESNGVHHYSIIFMDMQMPKMDGVTATKEIIQKYQQETPCIVALTANAFNSDKEACIEAGMTDYLSKPLQRDELVEILIKYSSKSIESKSA